MISSSMKSELAKMDVQQLRELNSYIVSLVKEGKAEKAWEIKNELRPRMQVKVNHRKVYGMVGIVKEVNRTRCKVVFDNTTFTVPLSMIEIIK